MKWLDLIPWKLVSAFLAAGLISLYIDAHSLRADRDKLHDQIHNEVSGYIVRLAECHRNNLVLESAVEDQNTAVENMAKLSANRLNEAAIKVEAAQKAAQEAQRKFDRLMAAPPKGSTVCERYDDIDSRFLETLK